MKLLIRLALVVILAVPVGIAVAQGERPTARVICSQYVRDAPSEDGAILGRIDSQPETLFVLALNPSVRWRQDGLWVLIEQPSTGLRGWMYDGDCLLIFGRLSQLPEMAGATGYDGPPVADLVCAQYLRSQPRPNAEPLAILQPGEPTLSVIGRDVLAEWLYVRRANGQAGWMVFTGCLAMRGTVRDAPVVRVVYRGPVVAEIVCAQVARLEPDNDAIPLTTFRADTGRLAVVGRDVYANWFLVVSADGRIGWVYNGDCLVIYGDIMAAPYPPPSAVNGVAFVPSSEITNITAVGDPVIITEIPPLGQFVVEGVSAPLQPQTPPVAAPEQPTALPVDLVGGPGQAVDVNVNCDATGGIRVRAGSGITLTLPWVTTDEALANDWLAAQRSNALLNGNPLPDIQAHLTSQAVPGLDPGTWVAGYFYPLGELPPGLYQIHWDMQLGRALSTGRADYPAGGYVFTCTFSVE